ncbi:MAG TPA: DUF4352 domain-containing protein [Symbiobacteriaceae bacterium]|nr:DUF4352 domain-containing protein [Symbiobacteriaceae bacterium]
MTKKRIALSLAVLLMLLAVGCGKKAIEGEVTTPPPADKATPAANATTTTPSTNNPSAPAQEEPKQSFFAPEPKPAYEKVNLGPLKVATPAQVGPLTVTLAEMSAVTKAPGLPPNYVYLVMRASVKNNGKEEYTINSSDHFKMETPEGKVMPFNIQATAQRNPRLQGTIVAGGAMEGWLGYLVKNQPGAFKYRFIHPDYGSAFWEFSIQ